MTGMAFQHEAHKSLALYLERTTEQSSLAQMRLFPPPYVLVGFPVMMFPPVASFMSERYQVRVAVSSLSWEVSE